MAQLSKLILFKTIAYLFLLMAIFLLSACTNPPSSGLTSPTVKAKLIPKPLSQMIAAANPLAAKVGQSILRKGGSAIDAAISAQLVLTLVEPQSSGIGGGAFLLHYDAKTGSIQSFDGRETAPNAAHSRMFLKKDGTKKKFYEAVVGGLAVGIPGLLRMLELAHKQHGRLPWKDLFQPAIKMAKAGFAISPRLASLISNDKYLKI